MIILGLFMNLLGLKGSQIITSDGKTFYHIRIQQ